MTSLEYLLLIACIISVAIAIREHFKVRQVTDQDNRLNRTAERIYIFWFWLIVIVVAYDAILNDFITNKLGIKTSPISDNTIELIKHGFIYFVAPMIFKLLKDSIPEFVQFAGALQKLISATKKENTTHSENENVENNDGLEKKYQE